MTKKFSIIIPFYNASKTLSHCIQALKRQTIDAKDYEIIFVDDASTDGGAQIIKNDPQLILIQQKKAGCAAARNKGIQAAKGELLLFTDSDCFSDPSWAEALIQTMKDPDINGAKGVYKTTQKSLTPRFVQIEYQEKYRFMEKFNHIDFIDTYAAIYRKKVFENERFDEGMRLGSDQEFSLRLASQGHQFQFCPKARVEHRHVGNFWGYLKKKFGNGFWKLKY